MSRKPEVPVRFAVHFLSYPQEYVEWFPTIAETARVIGVSNARLKRYLLGNQVPGISVYLGSYKYRGRVLPAYRIVVDNLDEAKAYLKEIVRNAKEVF